MKSLSLDLDTLSVETFETAAAKEIPVVEAITTIGSAFNCSRCCEPW